MPIIMIVPNNKNKPPAQRKIKTAYPVALLLFSNGFAKRNRKIANPSSISARKGGTLLTKAEKTSSSISTDKLLIPFR